MEKYRQFFENYTAQYDMSQWGIHLKYHHTFRVVDICAKLAQTLNLSDEDIELAKIIGLFHDIGRFEQWKRFGDFNDAKNGDHADFSVQFLQEDGILDDHPEKKLILLAIKNHNKFQIDSKITDDRTIKFCQLIRDADKLDIFHEVIKDQIPSSKLAATSQYSTKALQLLRHHQPINYSACHSDADYTLNKLGLFFDINFDYTKNCIKNEKIIQKIIALYIKTNPTKSQLFHELEQRILEVY